MEKELIFSPADMVYAVTGATVLTTIVHFIMAAL